MMSEQAPSAEVGSGPVAGGEDSSSGALALVETLAERLDAEGVTYCHWKSNEAIARSESGENDLDLLVADRDETRFVRLLGELGFIPAGVSKSRRIPGISDFYGVDAASGVLLHVHAHTRLVLGDDMTKNFHLPLEAAYLASALKERVLVVPRPEFEYLVFVLRMAVKHCPLDAVAMGKGRLTRSERRELAYLEDRIDRKELTTVRARHLPALSEGDLALLRDGLEPTAGLARRARAGRKALAVLRPLGRYSPPRDLMLRVGRRITRRAEAKWWPQRVAKTLGRGGALVAIVGGDGAGKSTVVSTLSARLGTVFRLEAAHMGKPPRSMLTRLVRKALALAGSGNLGGAHPAWDEFEQGPPPLRFLIGNALVARDRALQARRIRKAVARGSLVVTDRFPTPELVTMDTPRNQRVAQKYPSGLFRLLAGAENRYYTRMGAPDVTVVLRVSPSVAVERRSEQDPEFVERRAQEVFDTRWESAGVFVVDADAEPDAVYRQVLASLWRGLGRLER